ncbi:hypothetical protein [Caudoviricetes sp.]|nr:hypothetical protein [Caudoviricetes sp.]
MKTDITPNFSPKVSFDVKLWGQDFQIVLIRGNLKKDKMPQISFNYRTQNNLPTQELAERIQSELMPFTNHFLSSELAGNPSTYDKLAEKLNQCLGGLTLN